MFSIFLECSQMSGVIYQSVIHLVYCNFYWAARKADQKGVHEWDSVASPTIEIKVFRKGENLSTRGKTSRSRVENQQQTQPT